MSCPPQTTIKRGQQLNVEIDWQNTGTTSYAFDLIFLVGYIDATGNFVVEYGNYVLDVPSNPGEAKTTTISFTIPPDAPTGTRSGLGIIGDYDPATGNLTALYAYLLCQDSLVIQ